MERDFTVFMTSTLMSKFRYTPDQEDASDAPFLSALNAESIEFTENV
jgi:hypothetical protein